MNGLPEHIDFDRVESIEFYEDGTVKRIVMRVDAPQVVKEYVPYQPYTHPWHPNEWVITSGSAMTGWNDFDITVS